MIYLYFIKHLTQATQGGEIGFVLSIKSYVPYSSIAKDVEAAQRIMDFNSGWLVKLTYHVNITSFFCDYFFKSIRE